MLSTTDQSGEPRAVARRLAEATGTDPHDWHLVFRARYGMQVVFRAIADVRGSGDVATQLLTCATAVSPITASGLHPAYGEVADSSLALDPEILHPTDSTRAVMLQHTFGIIDHARAAGLRRLADEAGALLIEDSAHCVTRMARDESGAPLADVSIHSFGAEKILPTRFGGAVWVNPGLGDSALQQRLRVTFADLPKVGAAASLRSRLYRSQVRVLNRLPGGIAAPTRDLLTRAQLFEPLISDTETRGELPYAPSRPADWMDDAVVTALADLPVVERRRAAATEVYVRELAPVVQVPESIGGDAPLVRFPFFVDSTEVAERLIRRLTADGVYAGRWYRPALFPGVPDPARYGFVPGRTTPHTQELIERIVNLPTAVDASEARRAADIVRTELE